MKELYRINAGTGAATLLSTASPAYFVNALSFDPVGGAAYGAQSYMPGPVSQLLSIDLDSGGTSVVAKFTDIGLGNVQGLEIVGVVPEPSTVAIWSTLSLIGIAVWRRQRRA